MVPWSPTQKGKKQLCFSHYMSYCPARTQLGCGCLFHLQHLCILKNDFLLPFVKAALSYYSPTATEFCFYVCVCARGKVEGKGGKEEMEVVSAMFQLGITVKARFVGAMRKGICNFPPLLCTAVYNSHPSLLSLGFLLHFDFFYPQIFFL